MDDMETAILPNDLIGTKEAARLARCHLASVYRWILPHHGKPPRLRSWRRTGRLFVSRAELLGLFQPAGGAGAGAATVQAVAPGHTAVSQAEHDRWVEETLREAGFRRRGRA